MELNINYNNIFGSWIHFYNNLIYGRYFTTVLKTLHTLYKRENIYPEKENIFKCFKLCDYKNLKVVIIGQDPYCDGSATGLAFANSGDKVRLSPSLSKIKETVEREIYCNFKLDFDETLESWAKQGVLLLNTSLTVEKHIPSSHNAMWERFTKYTIKRLSEKETGLIFMLWGNKAKEYKKYIDKDFHYILECINPKYTTNNNIDWRCDNFVEANKIIENNNGKEYCIEW